MPRTLTSHHIGVGAFVLNPSEDKVLSIMEKNFLIPNHWKLPGGLVDSGESL